MNTDRNPRTGQVPLPGFAQSAPTDGWMPRPGAGETVLAARAVQTRTEGIRRVRRMSNWTAAVLIVGTGAATVALAHNAIPVSSPVVGSTSSTTTGGVTTAVTNGSGGPQVSHSVATTSASGVTTTTTTQVVNGKTVVSHVKNVAPGAPLRD